MAMDAITAWMAPALDAAIVALLGFLVWRLGADPTRAWRDAEERLRAILGELQGLVGEAEQTARDLDHGLAARAARLETLLAEAPAAARSGPARGAALEAEVAALAAEGLAAEDVARRLDVGVAEVRLMLGVQAVRAAAARAARGKNDAAETAGRS
jgi:hypothetical protein